MMMRCSLMAGAGAHHEAIGFGSVVEWKVRVVCPHVHNVKHVLFPIKSFETRL